MHTKGDSLKGLRLEDVPKSLGDSNHRLSRSRLLKTKHMKVLTAFVQSVQKETRYGNKIPFFDPADGGLNARCLFILEAPGNKAVATGFVSRDNPDETARNFFLLSREVGIPRSATAIWNIVPWYLGTKTRIRAANEGDVRVGWRYLQRLLLLLPKLEVICLVGRKAQRVEALLRRNYPSFRIITMPHPSPMYVNRSPGNRRILLRQLRSIAQAFRQRTGPTERGAQRTVEEKS